MIVVTCSDFFHFTRSEKPSEEEEAEVNYDDYEEDFEVSELVMTRERMNR